jgi:ribose transport system substrate-binding protein
MGGKGKFVVIEGTPKTPTNRERVRGYKRAFGEFPGIQVLGSEVGNYQQPDAKRAMEKLMKEHPEIDAVLSANDSMSLGALEALKETNRTATVMSINGILPAGEKGRNRRNSSYRRFQYVQDWMHGDARRCSSDQK